MSSSVAGEPFKRSHPRLSLNDQRVASRLRTKFHGSESFAAANSSRSGLSSHSLLWQRLHFHPRRNCPVIVDDGPAIIRPFDRRQKCLSAQVMGQARRRAKPEEHRPPTAIMRLNQINVSGALNRTRLKVAMASGSDCDHKLQRAPRTAAAGDGFGVTVFGSAFGNHQIVITVELIKMRALGTAAARARPERLDF